MKFLLGEMSHVNPEIVQIQNELQDVAEIEIATYSSDDEEENDPEHQQEQQQQEQQEQQHQQSDDEEQQTEQQQQVPQANPQVQNVAQKIQMRRNTGLDEANIIPGSRLREREASAMMAFMASMEINNEPQTYEQAIKSEDHEKWQQAMNEEFESLTSNQTWELVEKPKDKRIIDCKWIFKIKQNTKGVVERYKARMVARGFNQEYGVDYDETFSPVVRFTSIRLILSIAAQQNFKVKQFDIKTAFLYGELEEEVFMKQPVGFDDGSGKVCRLIKSIYGLKQASRCWNIKFKSFIEEFGFKACESDPCVFISEKNGDIVILAIHVDDGLITGNNTKVIDSVITHLQQQFEVKSMELGCFLGIEIEQLSNGSIFVHQSAYAQKVLAKFSMENSNEVGIPADPNQVLDKCNDSNEIEYPYRQLVGSLMYLAVATRHSVCNWHC